MTCNGGSAPGVPLRVTTAATYHCTTPVADGDGQTTESFAIQEVTGLVEHTDLTQGYELLLIPDKHPWDPPVGYSKGMPQ